LIISLETIVPERVQLLVELPVWCIESDVVVRSFASQTYPFAVVGKLTVNEPAPEVPVHLNVPMYVPPVRTVVDPEAHTPARPVKVNCVPWCSRAVHALGW
jgi:hypothetical protein